MGGWEGDARRASRRDLTRWIVFLALVPVAFTAVVVALNSGIYSAAGFVDRYLDALQRRDLATALELPGVEVPQGVSTAALQRDALPGLAGHRVVSDTDEGGGLHRVLVEYRAGDSPARTEFLVRASAPTFLVFQGWRFEESPVGRLAVTVRGDEHFRLNGEQIEGAEEVGPGVWALELAVLSPARLVLDHDSRYLTAEEVAVDVPSASAPAEATVEVRAGDVFVETVQAEVDEFLDGCAKQEVLQPAGCPFRKVLDDRILGAPRWSIASYPRIGIQPQVLDDGTFAWTVPPTEGTAHIRVSVLSLFDGSVSELDEDVPFRVAYVLALRDDGGLDIRAVQP
ncbi:hypothetical protein [Naasia sp. SYSU D00948]|uniref:hypothetical protein n=1 Tax=Naasia sp. SYSU D00948 TaxID=2817379 RepID=UPI001B30C665|nr:hypothetical protein [Naasia sp. SYSU D00948]